MKAVLWFDQGGGAHAGRQRQLPMSRCIVGKSRWREQCACMSVWDTFWTEKNEPSHTSQVSISTNRPTLTEGKECCSWSCNHLPCCCCYSCAFYANRNHPCNHLFVDGLMYKEQQTASRNITLHYVRHDTVAHHDSPRHTRTHTDARATQRRNCFLSRNLPPLLLTSPHPPLVALVWGCCLRKVSAKHRPIFLALASMRTTSLVR